MARRGFWNKTPEGYSGPGTIAPTIGQSSDEESDNDTEWERSNYHDVVGSEAGVGTPVSMSFIPVSGGPFSALIPTMWPQDILGRIQQTEDAGAQPDCEFDEFGNCLDIDREKDKMDPDPQTFVTTEDPSIRLKWIAYLESTENHIAGDLTWDKVRVLPKSDRLRELVYMGIPHSMRMHLWPRISGALKKKKSSKISYKRVIKKSNNDNSVYMKQIEKDLCRTMPSNACFQTSDSIGIPKLKRILMAIAWLYPDIGYCQGVGMIVSSLLLFQSEEDTFWMMVTIIDDLLPESYFSATLLGVQADQRVLRQLIVSFLPNVDRCLREHDIELSLITLHWFLTIMSGVLPLDILLRIWDIFFYEGSIILFKITLGMFKMREQTFLTLENSAQIFNCLSDLPGDISEVQELLDASFKASSSLTNVILNAHRKKHVAYLVYELQNSSDQSDYSPMKLLQKQYPHSRSWLSMIYRYGPMLISKQLCRSILSDDAGLAEKAKNIKQTEMISDLRESILLIAKHFKNVMSKKELDVDYSADSHAKDYENYVKVARSKLRRAKAVVDFERHEDDELGFRKHDIVTIISQKDEHCWIGELNGLRGWFPAKFVKILDERSKEYALAGDDTVSETVTDLVRGHLCSALRNIFHHGITSHTIFGTTVHPWHFIEEASRHEVDNHFNSVFSRLVLCKTFRLDDDGKVLSPEEILYRAVQAVNASHDAAGVSMDTKLRSLICYGLNEQVFHLWLEVLCSSNETLQKWYNPHSFLRSPAWIQIKCELRTLAMFSFRLSVDWEISRTKDGSVNMRDDVQDMLVKHHLFSWDI
eukprot:gene8950-9904_t